MIDRLVSKRISPPCMVNTMESTRQSLLPATQPGKVAAFELEDFIFGEKDVPRSRLLQGSEERVQRARHTGHAVVGKEGLLLD